MFSSSTFGVSLSCLGGNSVLAAPIDPDSDGILAPVLVLLVNNSVISIGNSAQLFPINLGDGACIFCNASYLSGASILSHSLFTIISFTKNVSFICIS